MYIWNGYTVIGKHKDLTEGMLKTLDEAQQKLEQNTSNVSVQLTFAYLLAKHTAFPYQVQYRLHCLSSFCWCL